VRRIEAELVAALALRERHRVDEPDLAGVSRERRLDHERSRQVAPLRRVRLGRSDRPVSGVGVEQSREHGIAVVAGQAEPVDRAVTGYERRRVAIGQQSVVRDRL
jgi:hypothetical protein